MNSTYITSAAKPEQLPVYELPELAFIGRSNTGKSSLLNSLLGRRNLARHGRTPGQTQMINFFSVNSKVILADLPGYGYNIARRDIAKHWEPLSEAYLRRPNITELIHLFDCRRKLEPIDEQLVFKLSRQLAVTVVMTKCDKLSRQELRKSKDKLGEHLGYLGVDVKTIIETSSLKMKGINELRSTVLNPYLD